MPTESLPKYQLLFEKLATDIRSGKFKPGAKLPSEAALVKKFNTSRITVGRALRDMQAQGLIDRIAGSGSYVRNTQRTSGPLLFGLLIPDLGETEVFEAICQGIANAGSDDHALLWGHSRAAGGSKEGQALELCRQFVARQVSGVFFAPLEFEATAEKTNRRIISTLREAGIPIVLLDRRNAARSERDRPDLVGLNNRQAAYVATEHLIQLGCKRIGFLGYHGAASTIAMRTTGYEQALHDYGLPAVMQQMDQPAGKDAEFDAYVCVNDRMAGQLMHSLLIGGLRIPEDIRIVGIDDASFAALLPVPLTTVRQPCRDIGAAALSTMLERIERPKSPARDVLLDGQLIVRKSSGVG